jgi:hypothetical protein
MANLGMDPRDGKTLYGMINPKYAGSYLRRGDTSGRWVTMPAPAQGYTYIGFTIDGATGHLYVASLQGNRHWQLWRTTNPTELDVSQVRWERVHDFGDESVETSSSVVPPTPTRSVFQSDALQMAWRTDLRYLAEQLRQHAL